MSRLSIGARGLYRSAVGAVRAGMSWSGYGGQGRGWRLLLPGSQYDYEAAAGDLWRNTAVAACLRWIKVNFPEPRVEVVKELGDGKHQVVHASEVTKLLNRPNRFWDRYQFDAACSLSYVVDGNCYIRKIRSASGKVVELWWIPHWMIFPRWRMDGTEFIGWYDYEVNGKTEKIPLKDIIHWKNGVDPRDDRRGFSDLKTGVRQICGLNECDTYTSAMLRNMGIVGAVISFDGDEGSIDPGEVDVLRDQWREDHTSEGRGTPLISPRGMKVQQLSMTPESMRLDKIPARLEDTIHSLVGLSPMVTNASSGKDHKTYANYGEARKAAYEDCLIPMQGSFAECLTVNLLDEDFSEGDRVRFDYAGIKCLAQNETEVAERVGKQYQIYQTIMRSEAREMQGLDWLPEDEVFFDEASKRVQDGEHLDSDGDDADGEGLELDGAGNVKAGDPAEDEAADKAQRGHEHRHPFLRDEGNPPRTPGTPVGDIDEPHANNVFGLPDGRPIRRGMKRWYEKQLKEMLGIVPAIGEPLPASFPPLANYDDPMASAMTPIISGYWDEGGKVTRAKLGLDPADWQVHDPHLHQVIKDTTFDFCKETNESTTKLLNDGLADLRKGLIAGTVTDGESIPQITKMVMETFENLSKYKAETIARTEASRAVHEASLRSAIESEVVAGKRWIKSANACPECVELVDDLNARFPNGVPLEQNFTTRPGKAAYANVKTCPLHPRDRCTVYYVLTQEYEDLLAEHGPPMPTFEPGSLGPEPIKRKIAKPKKPKEKLEPSPYEPAYTEPAGTGEEAIPAR